MNRPATRTFVLGHPVAVLMAVGLGLTGLYQAYQEQLPWIIAIAGLLWMSSALKAREQLQAYAQWQQAWDSMGGEAPARRGSFNGTTLKPWLGVTLLAGAAIYFFRTLSMPGHIFAFVLLVIGTVGLLIGVLRRRRPQRTESAAPIDTPVSISVGAPLIEISSLPVAYRDLPAHCQRVLKQPPDQTRKKR